MRTIIFTQTFNIDGKEFLGRIEQKDDSLYAVISNKDGVSLDETVYSGDTDDYAMSLEIENLIESYIKK